MPVKPGKDCLEVAPYFDNLLERLSTGDPVAKTAFGRHVHWGYWPEPAKADRTPEGYAAAAERLCQLVCSAAGIQDGMRILDVGCGFGGTIASLNDRFSGVDLVGVNIDARQLQRARATIQPRNGNRIQFIEGDACRLSFAPASFDVVLAVECIFHFDSRADFLRGAGKVLKPGGRLALSDFVPTRDSVSILEESDAGNDEATRITYGQVNLLCPVEDYRDLADAAGLTLAQCSDINAHTLPTYAFLQEDLRNRPDRATARIYSKATSRLEMACQMKLLRYTILAFTRRAADLAMPA